ncbi:MAG: acetyl-CoA carboxylase carboxyltransferase subunit alpha [Clostridium celatum]|nr:acetyl-CoA carboxylase carboxyltransferase subunit alpha [Clostridium celatum]MCE9654522.1 acetyl-CoA carboxylase carboxyltransferase subunit alpha [Clostridium celatum]MDU3722983.1 acetyl-CoA carboxylase carboxyltransferase subunit alpha [Clostridium celatum]MDU6294766.1 acetyl-CoA carboxylase carboxyltransferase subunit alpha [Clostridium celatum]
MMLNKKMKAWDRLEIARMVERPNADEYIKLIFNNFIELHGDRYYKDDKAVIGGIGFLEDIPVTIIGIQKGKNLKENIERNFGSAHPEGYRKAIRLMKQAEKFNRPIICFINTSGAYCGVEAEERGQGEAIAKNLMEIAKIKVPIISIIVGEGGSGGAIALACGDKVWMLENSIYSILSPEGFASILLKDASKAKEVSEVMGITSYDLLERGIIEKIIKEPKGGAQNDIKAVAESLKQNIIQEIKILKNKPVEELLEERYLRYRKF